MALTKTPIELSSTPSIVDGGNATAITIDSSENVLVGKTALEYENTAGHIFRNDGFQSSIRSGGNVADFNRLSSDGEIIRLSKDGATVGSIGAASGYLAAGSTNLGLYYNGATTEIYPVNTATTGNLDGTTNLGRTTARFKDLYLSGGAYLGGTAAANKLDDYEEGTFTPQITGVSSLSYSTQNGSYVKIGSYVWFSIDLQLASGTATSSALTFTGLPFPTASSSKQAFGAASWSYGTMIEANSLTGTLGIHITWAGSSTVALYYGTSQMLGTSAGVNITGRAIISGAYRTDS